jgi:hypothetical protein
LLIYDLILANKLTVSIKKVMKKVILISGAKKFPAHPASFAPRAKTSPKSRQAFARGAEP